MILFKYILIFVFVSQNYWQIMLTF